MAKVGKYRFIQPEALAKLGRLNIVARSVVEGFISGQHRSPYHGFSVEFASHREYAPGDDLRSLDWKTLARTDRYYIKQYEEETNVRCMILLDASESMAYASEGQPSKFVYGCYLAASLAYLMIRQQDPVGLSVFSDDVQAYIPPGGSMPHLNRLLETLEAAATRKRTDLANTFHTLAERVHRRSLIVIVSDMYHEPREADDRERALLPREVVRALSHFRHKKHEVILFHVLDPAEADFPFRRLSEFVDMETGRRVQADPRYVREEYRALVRSFLGSCRGECAALGIDYVPAETSRPYDALLQRYLGARKAAGMGTR